ncbi:hypothetical protein FSP39_020595 [Pinctada imbricata]|uniref:Uncharacterized protein n=1 Tax=Pinctada imbricata TaxID=66713 RepID=A0AA89C2J8_PINIB|nr:hypothetical protein FSP39_020595 [Pinctada imbricata]
MMNASTSNSTFKLQARTERAETEDGQQTNATVFTAFAAFDASGATIQVELSNDKNSLVVVGNGDDITADFNADTSYSKSESNLVITRILNNTCQAYFTGSGVGVKVSLGIRLLTVVVAAPNYLQGNTKGLLGNYDSDPNNDFVLPNGTILHTNSSQREIFNNFGQKWLIEPSDSLFTYPPGKSAGDYVDTAFEPLFVDEVDPQTLANATAQCGGASVASQACIFDFLATNDTALAQESGQTDTQGNAQIASLSNASPDLTGNETIYVRVNETVQLSYNASDDGTYSYVFLQTPSSNFHIDTSSGQALITWTPTDTNAVNISVTAQDDHNVFAPTIDTTIVLCGRCSERGTCNNNVTIETDTPNFYLASCDCDTGYSGSECESDFNGCANSPCDQGRTCIDLPPIEHALLDRAYNCSDCPTGFYENNTKCVDVDECSDPTTCSQVCTNLEGTYVCDCFSGYRKLNNSCVDVDECADQTHSCEQFCVNEPGNYSCSCAFGYDLNSDKKTCTLVTDMCAVNGLTCEHGCDNSTGTFQCFCRRGYQLDSNGQSCVDVDECQLNICTQNCTNTDGGYSCSCFSGYKLADDGVSCTECLPPKYGMECASTCSCGLGMDYCDPVKGCVCLDTFTGTSCSQDVDECAENPAICASTTKYCENEIGDYQCFCYDGFEHVGDACVDVDECSSIVTNVCPIGKSTCENNQGNYTCVCNQGYIQNGPYACTDIDECSQNSHGCEQGCTNVPGSYNCICEAGFQINNDRKTCTKVSDPCPAYSSLTCSYGCRMNGNNPECFCQSGYTLTTDSQTCIDVNECSDNSLNLCGVPENCVNTPGGHNCSCNAGFKLENDGRTCTACDQFHYGTNCAQTCNCGVGADHCDSVSGCVCRSGWLGDKCDTDIDECSSSVCTDPNAQCINSPGTYHCLCKDGYTNTARRRRSTTSSQCLEYFSSDIDECAQTNNCTQVCTNTPGSYVCSCHSGFQLINGTICSDIDECALPSVCDHDCINSEGGYTCSCRDGYNLNATDRMSCHPKTECVSTTCEQSCYVDNTGNEHCMCNSGYTLNSDGTSCDNIDECTLNNPCSSGDCLDLTPGFICNCPSGQKLSADKITCLDCDDGTYGVNCASNCTCAEATSTSCDKVAGTCTCAVGYQGLDCSTDIDECTTGSATCPSNSYCVNTPGSYRCQCEDGFVMANGNCSGNNIVGFFNL